MEQVVSNEVLKECFSIMDLTTLSPKDTPSSVRKLVEKVNSFAADYPAYPLPASVCVYPNFASVVRKTRKNPNLHVTTVAGCFPSSQSFLEVKLREIELAVREGLGIGDWAQSPIPNPQSPIPNPQSKLLHLK